MKNYGKKGKNVQAKFVPNNQFFALLNKKPEIQNFIILQHGDKSESS